MKYLSAHTDWVPHGTITNEFISIVLFGAGTNYSMFLLSRYREALRDGLRPAEAIVLALTRVGEAISSSAATVIAAMAIAMRFSPAIMPAYSPRGIGYLQLLPQRATTVAAPAAFPARPGA